MTGITRNRLILMIIVAALTMASVITTIFSLQSGIFEVFPYFYILPIIIIAYISPRHGVYFTIVLGWVYLGLVYLYGPFDIKLYASSTAWFYIIVSLGAVLSAFSNEVAKERKYRDIFLNSRSGIFTFDLETHKGQEFNTRIASIVGYGSDELRGSDITALWLRGEDLDTFLSRLKKEQQISDIEAVFRKKDGSPVWAQVTAALTKEQVVICSAADITEVKRVQEHLKESEKRYRSLFEGVPIGLYRTTPSGKILDINPALVRLLGYPDRESLLAVSVFDLYMDPGDRNRWLALIERKGIVRDFEVQFRKYDGTIIWVRDTGEAVRDDSGQVIYYNGNVEDITGRKRAEDKLQFTRHSIDSATESMATIAKDGHFADVNDAFCRNSGYSRDELLSMTVHDIDPDYTTEIWPAFWNKLKQSGSLTFETTHRSKEGRIYPVEITATYFEYNGNEYHCGFTRDITDRKRAEEALRESEKRYRTIIETAQEGIWTLDSNFHISFVNEKMAGMLGYTQHEMIGRSFAEFIPEGELPDSMMQVELRKKGMKDTYERRFLHRNGDIRTLLTSSATIYDSNKTFSGSFAMFTDITERKRAEEALKHFNEELEKGIADRTEKLNASLEEKVVLLHEIHHRVKNNLQIILSLIRLQSPNIKDPTLLDTMGDFQNRIMAMAHIHERMYRAEDISRIDLSEIVTFLGASLFASYQVDPQHIRLNVEIKDLQITIDSAIPISLIINELVSNSIKHAFPKGTTGEITIAGHREADTLVLSFKDTGIGIPNDLDWMRSTQSLGLRLVVGLVQQLNGTIELDRTTGTTFNIVVKEKQ
jgi:PAS domain S-box-containing protein